MWRTEDPLLPASIWGLSPSDRGPALGWCEASWPLYAGVQSSQSQVVWECSPKRVRGSAPGLQIPPRAHFFLAEGVPRDRLWSRLGRAGEGGYRPRGRELYSARPLLAVSRGPRTECPLRHAPAGRHGSPLAMTIGQSRTVPSAGPTVRRRKQRTALVNWRQGSAAMSATHPTRLETRTKESNACASQRFHGNTRRNESEGRRASLEDPGGGHHRRLARSAGGGHGARGAHRANYAWAEEARNSGGGRGVWHSNRRRPGLLSTIEVSLGIAGGSDATVLSGKRMIRGLGPSIDYSQTLNE
ncbi:hypothetical protein DPEC_G00361260 [Dallia pectoralis]|uniref:Uncharacterized protein n=1 Tax=Dallia pectoralis TaxID=75939 RepID=A0ACC2F122_DALPE|nr:hypothetical protein DPEC_G00361260 [Dallia pectoralis]